MLDEKRRYQSDTESRDTRRQGIRSRDTKTGDEPTQGTHGERPVDAKKPQRSNGNGDDEADEHSFCE
jgi:hypothetical protein